MKNWILAIRPKTLLASISPVFLGIMLAKFTHQKISVLLALMTLICGLLLQIASNIANDYLDSLRGVDNEKRIGPTRVTQEGLIPASQMKRALFFTLLTSFILGIFLMVSGGLPIVIIGLFSLYFAYGYTGGPFPLSYNGLGEVAAFIFFGLFAVGGSYYLQTKSYSFLVFLVSIGPGLISACILAINNLRDIHTDSETNKKTIAVRFGEKFQRRLCIVLIALSFILPILVFALYQFKMFFVVSFLPFFFIKNWTSLYYGPISSEMNTNLARTAQYLFLYCLLSAAALNYPW